MRISDQLNYSLQGGVLSCGSEYDSSSSDEEKASSDSSAPKPPPQKKPIKPRSRKKKSEKCNHDRRSGHADVDSNSLERAESPDSYETNKEKLDKMEKMMATLM